MEMIRLCKSSICSSLGELNQYGGATFSAMVALTLLSDIPGEVASRSDLTTTELNSFLVTRFQSVDPTTAALETLQLALSG